MCVSVEIEGISAFNLMVLFSMSERILINVFFHDISLTKTDLEDPGMQEKIWGAKWGINNDVGKLRMVLVHRPGVEWDVMMSGGEYVPEVNALLGPGDMWYWKGRERPGERWVWGRAQRAPGEGRIGRRRSGDDE